MKRIALMVFAVSMAHPDVNAWGAEAPPLPEIKSVAGSYGKQLKGTLQEAMSKNGPEAAVTVCSEKATQIGAEFSHRTGWSIKRVSSKARNPLDMPDTYEQATLSQFESDIASGKEDPSRYEVVTEGGVRYARFMKAIRVEGVCLACHGGSEVAPNVARRLDELYPFDAARGYKMGDLRGALSIKVKLDKPER